MEEARALSIQLDDLPISLEIIIATHFDHFISTISSKKIDCFILDWKYTECSIVDLAEKLRKSNKYRRAPLAFVTEKKDAKLPFQYSVLNVDFVISKPFQLEEYKDSFVKSIEHKSSHIIPENFNVLVLDNNPDILELMEMHMEQLKHKNFDMCESVESAKKLISEKDYDLMLLDWNLDDGTCIDLIEFSRAKNQTPRVQQALIMVITGRDDVDDIMTLLRYNVKDHIIKPFDYGDFEEKIIYALDRHKKSVKSE